MAKKTKKISVETKRQIDAVCEKYGIRREKQRCAVKEYISRQTNGLPWDAKRPAYGIGLQIEKILYREGVTR